MTTVDPIVQCEACGAKLRLKAASLKVLKQVRCGKCQAMIEIPQALKDGSPIPDTPVLAKATVPETPSPAPVPAQAPSVVRPVPPPAPVVSSPMPVVPPPAATVPAPVPVTAAPAPAVPPPAPVVSAPTPVIHPPAVPTPVAVPPLAATSAPVPAIHADPQWNARLDALEVTVRTQQETIEKLTLQLKQVVQVQTAAANACLSALGR